jgi:hypothetical protein
MARRTGWPGFFPSTNRKFPRDLPLSASHGQPQKCIPNLILKIVLPIGYPYRTMEQCVDHQMVDEGCAGGLNVNSCSYNSPYFMESI